METKLLDTTFLVHHWGGYQDVKTYLEAQSEHTDYVTTTINLKELAVGRKLTGDFDPVETRAQFQWVRVVPITADIAWNAAELEAPLYADTDVNRDRINDLTGDVLIAGAAAHLDASVVTKNVDDFEELGVTAEAY